jgi:predicted LPLAT superfamily acyltransferase
MGLLPHSWLAKWRFTYRHFYSFGQTLLDRVAIISGNASAYSFEFDGEEHLAQALKEGKGMVIVSAHFGNWQAAAHLLGSLNAPLRLVAYEAEVAPIRELMAGVFSEGRFSVIPLEDAESASLAIMSALRNKEIVALHGDRVMDQASAETVPFLGAPARFPMGPFVVAALSGAPLVHTFAVRTKNWHYRLKAFPPEHLAFGRRADRAGLLQNWIKQFVERLEAVTRQYPLQWYNFYNFWETAVSQSGPGGRRR